ncbi:MAG: hypothetical protein ACR2NU_10105 [Aeoliella sp.]
MEVIIRTTYEEVSKLGAQIVADVFNTNPDALQGMATGSTPHGFYAELVRLDWEKGL